VAPINITKEDSIIAGGSPNAMDHCLENVYPANAAIKCARDHRSSVDGSERKKARVRMLSVLIPICDAVEKYAS